MAIVYNGFERNTAYFTRRVAIATALLVGIVLAVDFFVAPGAKWNTLRVLALELIARARRVAC